MKTAIELRSGYLQINCSGTYSAEEALKLYEEAFRHASECGRKVILVDVRGLTGAVPDTVDRYDQGVRVAELQRGIGMGIALAILGNEPFIDPDRLGEIVSANRGGFARVFTDPEAAVAWVTNDAISFGRSPSKHS